MTFKSIVLHSEHLVCLPPIIHVKITVDSLLKRILLFGRFHARDSRNPQMLIFVVSPFTSISEWRSMQVKKGILDQEDHRDYTPYGTFVIGVDKNFIRG